MRKTGLKGIFHKRTIPSTLAVYIFYMTDILQDEVAKKIFIKIDKYLSIFLSVLQKNKNAT
jgi:hypothetical protein